MSTPNEFWLYAHRLTEAYEAEGLTPEERAINVTNELLAMPPTARRQVLGDLRILANQLVDLYPIASAAASTSEELRGQRREDAA
jgi:hypothetical protein